MHPEIHAPKPGNCPKCGMTLIKKKPKAIKKKAAQKQDKIQTRAKGERNEANPKAEIQKKPITIEDQKKEEAVAPKEYNSIPKDEPSKIVRYDLYVRDTIVNFAGKEKRAIAVNGQIPMPTLTFTDGDTAEIYVNNELDEDTSLH